MTTNNNRHHIHHHEHLDEAEIYKRKNLSAAQRRKKLAKILFRVLCVIAVSPFLSSTYILIKQASIFALEI